MLIFWLVAWGLLVIAPLILGGLGKVNFRWVLLWEVVMFSPILILFAILIIPGKKLDMERLKKLYIPSFKKPV